ncbi:MAG: UDP-3-O-acyl-N-acetylglucosamine deacetylase, partial [Bacteroidia bacterium]
MSEKQKTIKQAVSVTGVGLHTGMPVTLTFNPAPENHWFKFQRVDVEGQPIIEGRILQRLLEKLEQMRSVLADRVFDVIGEVLS